MQKSIEIDTFLQTPGILLDVRSPSEYARGHIPGAISFPIFNDTERAEIGTLYKQKGREAAVLRGLEIIGPRMAEMVIKAKELCGDTHSIRMYCWRGGMRSGALAWLLSTAGMRVNLLQGGYKSWRKHVLAVLAQPLQMLVVGGYTGSGKTRLLHTLQASGYPVLDLEALASHKGSSFGGLGMQPQPTQEHFENLLTEALMKFAPGTVILTEDESRMIGRISLPNAFWEQKNNSILLFLDQPVAHRIPMLMEEYAQYPDADLRAGIERISKKLGGERTALALQALEAQAYAGVAEQALYYYDKAYRKGLEFTKHPEKVIRITETDPQEIIHKIIEQWEAQDV